MDGALPNRHRDPDDGLTVIVPGNRRPFESREITRCIEQLAMGMPAAGRGDKTE